MPAPAEAGINEAATTSFIAVAPTAFSTRSYSNGQLPKEDREERRVRQGDVTAMPASSSTTAQFAGVLFEDNNGTPGNLLNTGTAVRTITAGTPISSAFVNPTGLLMNVQYWIGFMVDTAVAARRSSSAAACGACRSPAARARRRFIFNDQPRIKTALADAYEPASLVTALSLLGAGVVPRFDFICDDAVHDPLPPAGRARAGARTSRGYRHRCDHARDVGPSGASSLQKRRVISRRSRRRTCEMSS